MEKAEWKFKEKAVCAGPKPWPVEGPMLHYGVKRLGSSYMRISQLVTSDNMKNIFSTCIHAPDVTQSAA